MGRTLKAVVVVVEADDDEDVDGILFLHLVDAVFTVTEAGVGLRNPSHKDNDAVKKQSTDNKATPFSISPCIVK